MYVRAFQLPDLDTRTLTSSPVWRCSEYICALSDGDRHLGHVVEDMGWHAYDAIHPAGTEGGFRYLGLFEDVTAAKGAVELSTGYLAGAYSNRGLALSMGSSSRPS
jgi:hypothetical protein